MAPIKAKLPFTVGNLASRTTETDTKRAKTTTLN